MIIYDAIDNTMGPTAQVDYEISDEASVAASNDPDAILDDEFDEVENDTTCFLDTTYRIAHLTLKEIDEPAVTGPL